MSREYPERPVIGVGVVVVAGDKVLLVKRAKPPRSGEWSLPGGAQEIGESLKEAGRREVREECGIDIEIAGLLDVVDFIDRDDQGCVRNHYSLVDFWAELPSPAPLRAGDDALEAAWFSKAEARKRVEWEETRRVISLAFEAARK